MNSRIRAEERRDEKMRRLVGVFLALAMALTLNTAAFADGGGDAYDFSAAQVGDIITFGSYEQDNDFSNGPEPIEWRVLAKEAGRLLVISRYGLECRPFNAEWKSIIWKTCDLRKWLNSEFVSAAFTSDEQQALIPVLIQGDGGRTCSWNKVFLLSRTEAAQLFSSDTSRQCELTAYAKAQGYYANSNEGNCWWWLLSPGYYTDFAALVNPAGSVDTFGGSVITSFSAVRPAMWVYRNGRTEKPAAISEAEVGDWIVLGSYEQDNNELNGHEPIEWLVLAKEEDRILAISRYALDCLPYNTEESSVTWENSTIRAWLNGDFLNEAFTDEERDVILTATVSADGNPEWESADPENNTADKVFLLSIQECESMCDKETRIGIPTMYAEAQGCKMWYGACEWWLRSPGSPNHFYVAKVYDNGEIDTYGINVNSDSIAVRPAVWISLEYPQG